MNSRESGNGLRNVAIPCTYRTDIKSWVRFFGRDVHLLCTNWQTCIVPYRTVSHRTVPYTHVVKHPTPLRHERELLEILQGEKEEGRIETDTRGRRLGWGRGQTEHASGAIKGTTLASSNKTKHAATRLGPASKKREKVAACVQAPGSMTMMAAKHFARSKRKR